AFLPVGSLASFLAVLAVLAVLAGLGFFPAALDSVFLDSAFLGSSIAALLSAFASLLGCGRGCDLASTLGGAAGAGLARSATAIGMFGRGRGSGTSAGA